MNQRKQEKIYEDRPFKEGDKVLCSSRIKEAEGEQNLYHLVSKWKNQRKQIWKILKT